jgi:hypothetical protein
MNWLVILGVFVVGTYFGVSIGIFVAGMCAAARYGDRFVRSHD